MKIGKTSIGALTVLVVLAACNLNAEREQTSIPWETFAAPSAAVTLPSGGMTAPSATAPAATATATSTPTADPLAVPRLENGSPIDILRVEMIDAQNGWGIGGPLHSGNAAHVFRTYDGGSTWIEVTPPETAESAGAVSSMAAIGFFADMQTGWVIYHALIPSSVPDRVLVWRTADGGRTWQPSEPLGTTGLTETFSVSHIFFSGTQSGWVLAHVGAGMNHDYVALYRSTDGGARWTRVIDPGIDGGIQSCSKTGMGFADGANGWLTGDCHGVRPGAFLFQTTDAGAHWSPVYLPAPHDPADLYTADRFACSVRAPFVLGQTAFVGVECADMANPEDPNAAFLYDVSLGGISNFRAYPGGDLFTLDGIRIWALGADIHRSEDGGQSWGKISSVTWTGQFDFVSDTTGWAAVQKGGEYGLVHTSDGGAFWIQLEPVVAAGS
ncbi:MAG: hypothetical protein JW929_11725 [Anaerolineales bacterium]|nr:hypothetical protein [Anaerolineales bacterium]